MRTHSPARNSERALLVGVGLKSRGSNGRSGAAERESLAELNELARSAGAQVVGSRLQMRDAFDAATLVGRGMLGEIKQEASRSGAELIIFDRNLSPVQQRNLESGADCRVIDRTQLILDIFARHAHSREGQLQVELAQLNYSLPRLAGSARELSRLGGGIGTRGPGEQRLETDRRRIRDRVRHLTAAIEKVRRQRALRRRARQAVPLGTAALVGYTNAGKSTLFNALTGGETLASAKMFATLDPTVRGIRLQSKRRVLLSDTVGFIRDLPSDLIAAFRATLEEVQESAIIVQVTDISNPAHNEQDTEVEKVLEDLGVASRPRLRVLNKIDRIAMENLQGLRESHSSRTNGSAGMPAIFVSALTGAGLDELQDAIDATLPVDRITTRKLNLPAEHGREISMIYGCGKVMRMDVKGNRVHIEAQIPESLAQRLSDYRE